MDTGGHTMTKLVRARCWTPNKLGRYHRGMSDIWITLDQKMIDYVDRLNLEITNRKARKGSTPSHRGKTDYTSRFINGRNGYRGEAATRLYLGGAYGWTIESMEQKLPDFAGFIDVKARRKTHHKLIVGKTEEKDAHLCLHNRAYLLVCGAHHPRWRIVGWCWGWEAMVDKNWQQGGVDDNGEPRYGYFVRENDPCMKPPEWLKRIVTEPRQPMWWQSGSDLAQA